MSGKIAAIVNQVIEAKLAEKKRENHETDPEKKKFKDEQITKEFEEYKKQVANYVASYERDADTFLGRRTAEFKSDVIRFLDVKGFGYAHVSKLKEEIAKYLKDTAEHAIKS